MTELNRLLYAANSKFFASAFLPQYSPTELTLHPPQYPVKDKMRLLAIILLRLNLERPEELESP